jgi:uncharacterized protein DUF6491
MKSSLAILALLVTTLSACATASMSDTDKLSLYRSHAGAPVRSFHYFGQINSWTPLGDSAIAVWTKPSEAWLLDLAGRCPDIEYTPVITVTSQMGMVNAKFDKVVARGQGSMDIPCQISEIRPLDVKAIRGAERTSRDQAVESSGT